MKATFKRPKSAKEWLSFSLIVFVILLGSWPVIPIFNKEVIVFGMPLIMTWSVFIIFLTTFIMWLINRIGGVK
ncbi:MAG TPA: hypothetical protein VNM69_21860 [Bacillus sp. (in: firmicutes)]|uniref:hypothetical protein n=1 Tax=Bacillus litorisediminis TaxID=2922713 RepID=UPI001FAFC1CC|nr:hypothetical protein [Bacillus litorisediminis]HWO78519.1 hypothetical protein [Bacillus sp. (in: firmicutes)]